MENVTGSSPGERRHLRDWVNPLRLYDWRVPVGRLEYLWGLAVFPLVVIFVLLTAIIIVVETISPNINPDYIGIIVWPFMLLWVAANVTITRRRLLTLGMPPKWWVRLAILPILNLPLFVYLLLKPDPATR